MQEMTEGDKNRPPVIFQLPDIHCFIGLSVIQLIKKQGHC